MSTYTHGHGDAVLRNHRWRDVTNSAGYLLPLLRSGMSILDVGCGPGTITADLARHVAPGRVLGVDSSAEVVDHARINGGPENLRFRVADLHDLGAGDNWDIVHAHQVLQHVADPVGALRELVRVARPGGTVAVRDADYGAMTWWPYVPGLQRWREVYRSVARANGGEPDAGRRLLGWAHAAGAGDVTASAATWCFATPEDRAWWGASWANRTTEGPFAERAVQLNLASPQELAQISGAWLDWSTEADGWFTVVHAELLIGA